MGMYFPWLEKQVKDDAPQTTVTAGPKLHELPAFQGNQVTGAPTAPVKVGHYTQAGMFLSFIED